MLTLANMAMLLIVLIAVFVIVYLVIKHLGVVVPPIFVQIFWIVLAVVFAIVAIKTVISVL